ncbi:ABC transporter substrate-binding protein, partial [Marinibaculum pumilum]
MRIRRAGPLILLAALGLTAAACANQQGSAGQGATASVPKNTLPASSRQTDAGGTVLQPPADDQIRVGFLAPLSGPQQAVGQALLNAAQMAVFDQPRAKLVLLPRDTKGRPDGAAAAASEAAVEGAVLLVGPLFAESTRAATPVAKSRGLGVISFSSNRQVAGDGVYILGFTPGEQAERIVSYAVGSGLTRLAILAPDNAYGTTVVQGAQRAAGRQ